MQDANVFEPHGDKQSQAILSEKAITLVATGTQWGKTVVGALRMKRAIHTHTSKSDNFIITSPSYKIMRQSTLPAFLKIMDGYGSWNSSMAEFKVNSGGTVFMRTSTDPDSVVGITNTRHIWCDEAGKYPLYFWENIQSRAEFLGAPIDLTTSPYSLNWVLKEIIKPHLAGLRDDVTLVQAASWENPYHSLSDPIKLGLRKATMDPRRFNMIYGGQFGKAHGLVFDCFDEEENQIQPFQLPVGTKYYGGVDWGTTHPFVLNVRAITPEGKHYGVSEYYKTGQTITDFIAVAKQKKQVFGIQTFYCDPSQPGLIEEFNRNGLPAVGADNDIRRGCDLHYELIKSRRIKYFRNQLPFTMDEYETYHYPDPEDLGPDDNDKEQKPVDQNNHAMDAERYITIMTYRTHLRVAPRVPMELKPNQETYEQKMRRLKKRPGSGHTENF